MNYRATASALSKLCICPSFHLSWRRYSLYMSRTGLSWACAFVLRFRAVLRCESHVFCLLSYEGSKYHEFYLGSSSEETAGTLILWNTSHAISYPILSIHHLLLELSVLILSLSPLVTYVVSTLTATCPRPCLRLPVCRHTRPCPCPFLCPSPSCRPSTFNVQRSTFDNPL